MIKLPSIFRIAKLLARGVFWAIAWCVLKVGYFLLWCADRVLVRIIPKYRRLHRKFKRVTTGEPARN